MTRISSVALALILSASGCQSASDEAGVQTESSPPRAAAEVAPDGSVGGAPVMPVAQSLPTAMPDSTLGRRLIRTADVGLMVDDVASARTDVTRIARQAGGFVGAENETRHNDRTEVHLTLRVPAGRFDAVLDAITAAGDDVAYRNVRVEDVTEQVVDLEARLRARRAILDRYLQLLARADDVGEILAVETKVAETQEAIEVAEGQLRSLRDRIGLSTIDVTISDGDVGLLADSPPFTRRLREAFAVGLAGVAEFALGLVALWPAWLIGGALFVVVRSALRRRRVAPAAAPAG
jgi:hypothetical protein